MPGQGGMSIAQRGLSVFRGFMHAHTRIPLSAGHPKRGATASRLAGLALLVPLGLIQLSVYASVANAQCWGRCDGGGDDYREEIRDDMADVRREIREGDLRGAAREVREMCEDLRRGDRRETRDECREMVQDLRRGNLAEFRRDFRDFQAEIRDRDHRNNHGDTDQVRRGR